MAKNINCVLLVDDEAEAIFTNYRLIKSLHLTEDIQTVLNGKAALTFIQDYCKKNEGNPPELILLDMKMPVMDGLEFLHHFKLMKIKNKEQVKIIIVTNFILPNDLITIKENNIGHIVKPLSKDKLLSLLYKQV